jgi:nitroreductase
MMLQAEELGLGTCWVCVFDPVAVAVEFGLPENLVPSSLMPIGYAAGDAEPAPWHYARKPLPDTVRFV